MLPRNIRNHRDNLGLLLVIACLVSLLPLALHGQENDDSQAMKQKIDELVKLQQYVQALPLLEKMVVIEPRNHEMHLRLGFALLAQTNVTPDEDAKKALRIRAREAFTKAKETGDAHPVVEALIQSIPLDGSEGPAFSSNKAASDLMEQAEGFFSQGKERRSAGKLSKGAGAGSEAL